MELQTKVPFDELIEKAVLGAIMQNNEVLLNLTNSLKTGNFYLKKHRDIYQVMLDLFEESSPIDENRRKIKPKTSKNCWNPDW